MQKSARGVARRLCGAGLLAIVAGSILGCASPASVADVELAPSRLIYDADDRADPYAVTDAALVDLALHSAAALIPQVALSRDAAGHLTIAGTPLAERRNLCAGEAFAAQPSVATCSGVLLTENLVLTAGHCVTKVATCAEQTWVFGYAMTEPNILRTLLVEDLYRCKSVPVVARIADSGARWDFAVVELERPVAAPRVAVRLAQASVREGDAMTVIGYPNGLPVKIAGHAPVTKSRSDVGDYFELASDTYEINSGSGVFDASGQLAGVFVRGGTDYEYAADGDCFTSRHLATSNVETAEAASYWQPAVACLCEAGWLDLCELTSAPCPPGVVVTTPTQNKPMGCTTTPNASHDAVLPLAVFWFVRRGRRRRARSLGSSSAGMSHAIEGRSRANASRPNGANTCD